MEKQRRNAIISNVALVLMTIAVVCCLIGFTGGFLYYDTVVFKWMAGSGIVLGLILYAVYAYHKPDVDLTQTNKIVRIICLVFVGIAILIFTCFIIALITLTFLNIFHK